MGNILDGKLPVYTKRFGPESEFASSCKRSVNDARIEGWRRREVAAHDICSHPVLVQRTDLRHPHSRLISMTGPPGHHLSERKRHSFLGSEKVSTEHQSGDCQWMLTWGGRDSAPVTRSPEPHEKLEEWRSCPDSDLASSNYRELKRSSQNVILK